MLEYQYVRTVMMKWISKTIASFNDFIIDSSHLFKEGFLNIIITLFARDPCKKCLVRACCSERCEHKTHYSNFCNRDGGIIFERICAYSVIFSCIMIIVAIFTTIFK